ncbi:MAG: CotH kinase family protein, partial [Planctomycetota bacterium]|nr:CotH kinase family protein [Planctomycetota bacterium]
MRVSIVCSAWLCLFCLAIAGQASAQSRRDERSGADDPDRPRREGESRQRLSPEELRQRFDRNGDGDLDDEELRALRDFLAERRGGGPPGGRGFGGRGFGPGGRGFGGRGFGPGGRRPGRQTMRLVEKFDDDGNGRLDDGERARAREYVEKKREDGPGFGPPGGRFGGRFGGRGGPPPEEEDPPREPERVAVDGVELYPDRSLYDPKVLRTFFLVFPQEDWEEEMADFYRTDVDVPANLVVDGKKYPEVGVRFRGNSSFFGVSSGKKRSLNLSIDHSEDGRDLYGYKTLNLLNSHSDPSFLRHILHDHIARQYLPATRSNLVKLVINGESWGVYVNVQQFNKDFLGESFGSREGVRWKIPQGRGGKGLTYNGDDVESYRGAYQLKTPEDPAAWRDLVRLTRLLEETPREELVSKLAPVLDIDGALWFIAVDSVLMDGDGYISRASDFTMYQDPGGRFHLMPYDSNETFGLEGGGPGGGRRGRFGPPGFGPPGGFGPGGGPGGFGPGGGPGGAGGRERG